MNIKYLIKCIIILLTIINLCSCGKRTYIENDINENINTESTEQVEIIVEEQINTEIETEISSEVFVENETEPIEGKNENISNEKVQQVVLEDKFYERTGVYYSLTDVVFYSEPNENSVIKEILTSGRPFPVDSYNPVTGWLKCISYYSDGTTIVSYCKDGDYMTTEEYRNYLNRNVDPKYNDLSCVNMAEEHLDSFMTVFASEITGHACVHIRGKHNFVSLETADACNERRFTAEEEWNHQNEIYGVNNHDGTVSMYSSVSYGYGVVSIDEFYQWYYPEGARLFDSYEEKTAAEEEYVFNAVMEVLNK